MTNTYIHIVFWKHMIRMFKNPYKIGLSLLFTETLLTAIELQSISETNSVALV